MIDPEIQRFVDGVAAGYARFPAVMTVGPDEARAIVEEVRRPWREGGPVMADTVERRIELPDGTLRIRAYRPHGVPAAGAAALLYLHGGGFTFFSIDTHDRLMREYAERAGIVVIGIDYPLAPEAKFPVALDQIVQFVDWLHDGAAVELGVDPARLALGGDSAGGNLSLAAAVQLRDAGRGDRLHALLLNYPGITPDKSAAAIARFGDDAILSHAEIDFFWDRYLRGPADRHNPLANLKLADMADLPPMIFAIAEEDILAEEGIEAAERVRRAGGDVTIEVYPGVVHGFVEAMSVSRVANRAIDDAARWLGDRLGTAPAVAEPAA